MSRLSKKPIILPAGVALEEKDGFFVVKGPKGENKVKIMGGVKVDVKGNEIRVSSREGAAESKFLGTTWSLLKNAVLGVLGGFSRTLEIEGVGYRAVLEDKELVLHLGYVNPVRFKIPEGVSVKVEKNTVEISGADKDLVGRTAAEIRALKKPEPYKGKGIRYRGEVIRRKAGKKAGAAAIGAPAA